MARCIVLAKGVSKIKYIAHFGLHHPVNAGDTLLFHSTRELFDYYFGDQHWKLFNIRDQMTSAKAEELNENAKAIVIGGGGMIADKGFESGWQFNCSLELLEQIKVPIIVFGIGYNLFRGQELSEKAKEHLAATAKQAAFFGVREKETVRLLKEITGEDIAYQPCPTAILSKFYPLPDVEPTRIGFNWAGDGMEFRIGAKKGRKEKIESLFRELQKALPNNIDLTQHLRGDNTAWKYLDGNRIDLHLAPPKTIINYYAQVELNIGMRLHSQLIPFGLGNGFIGLESHPKVGRALTDLHFEDRLVNLKSDNLSEELQKIIEEFDYVKTGERIEKEKEDLWDLTLFNLAELKNI